MEQRRGRDDRQINVGVIRRIAPHPGAKPDRSRFPPELAMDLLGNRARQIDNPLRRIDMRQIRIKTRHVSMLPRRHASERSHQQAQGECI